MVNHPNRNKTPPDAETYRPIDAVRFILMAQNAVASLKNETSINAEMVALAAMRLTYGVVPPVLDEQYPHILKFAGILLKVAYDPADEEVFMDPLPGENAQDHARRLAAKGSHIS